MTQSFHGTVPFVTEAAVPAGQCWSGAFASTVLSVTVAGGASYHEPAPAFEVSSGDLLLFAPGAFQRWQTDVDEGWERPLLHHRSASASG